MKWGIDNFSTAIADFEKQGLKHSPPWLSKLRMEALDRFYARGLPQANEEDWRYTSLRSLRDMEFSLGQWRPDFQAESYLQSLPEVLTNQPESVQPFFSKLQNPSSGFGDLNAALFDNGYFLDIKPNTVVESPVVINWGKRNSGTASFARNLIRVGAGAKVKVFETYENKDASRPFFHSAHTQILVEEDASLEFCKFQNQGEGSQHFSETSVQLQARSQFKNLTLDRGARLARNFLAVDILAEEVVAELLGLYLNHGQQHLANHLQVAHHKPNAKSFQLYKGLLKDNARAVFSGKIIVKKHASGTVAQQTNKTLLMSETAEIDTKPQLQIDNDDVKCNHGAAVGQLSKEEMFYLQSRGLTANIAQATLAKAFVSEVLRRFNPDVANASFQPALQSFLDEIRS